MKPLLFAALLLASTSSRAELTDDAAEAATASGLTSFVGLVLGALGTPAALGISSIAFGTRASSDDLLLAAVLGGTLGAGAGGALGAWPTTTSYGPLVVGSAASAGALLGLIPAASFGKHVYFGQPSDLDAVGHSASLFLAVTAASSAAAIGGALMAAP